MDTSNIINSISEQLGVSPYEITGETAFADLGADSFDLFQVISALEEEFEVTFNTDDTDKIKTVKDAIYYISNVVAE